MTQTIDPVKLKAAAEHLDWVLKQYPESEDVQSLLRSLMPLIEDAKAGRVFEPVDRIPCGYNFADGVYEPYADPDVGNAYAKFLVEMQGGLTEQGKELHDRIEAIRQAVLTRGVKS
jgi:hypothetical protein